VNIYRVMAMVIFIDLVYLHVYHRQLKGISNICSLKNQDYIFYIPTTQLCLTSTVTTYVDNIIRHGEARMVKYTSRGNEVTKTSKNLLSQS